MQLGRRRAVMVSSPSLCPRLALTRFCEAEERFEDALLLFSVEFPAHCRATFHTLTWSSTLTGGQLDPATFRCELDGVAPRDS